jgi:hypothetical protein
MLLLKSYRSSKAGETEVCKIGLLFITVKRQK